MDRDGWKQKQQPSRFSSTGIKRPSDTSDNAPSKKSFNESQILFDLNYYKSKYEEANKENEKLRSEINKNSSVNSTLVAFLVNENADLKEKLKANENNKAEYDNSLLYLTQQLENALKMASNLERDKASLLAEVEELKKEFKSALTSIKDSVNLCKEYKNKNEKLQSKLIYTKEQLINEKAQYELLLKDLNELKQTKSIQDSTRNSASTSQNKNRQLNEEIASLKTQLESAQEMLDVLNQDNLTILEKYNNCDATITELTSQNEALSDELSKTQKMSNKLKIEVKYLKGQLRVMTFLPKKDGDEKNEKCDPKKLSIQTDLKELINEPTQTSAKSDAEKFEEMQNIISKLKNFINKNKPISHNNV